MGVLPDLFAPHSGYGTIHAQILRCPTRPSLRASHRWIHLALFPLHHHPRPRRHLDGTLLANHSISLTISSNPVFFLI